MSKVKKIIEQYFRQSQSESIQRDFFFWLKRPISLQEKEKNLLQLWENVSITADSYTEESYRKIEQRLGWSGRYRRSQLYLSLMRIAAIFLIPMISLLAAWLYVENRPVQEIRWIECYVPYGEIREIILPDNSQALINSGSIIFYPEDFKGKERNIYLNGEAKFTVSKDKKKPFIVQTKDMSVEALGTVFNVSSFSNNPHTTATLVEGKVGINIRSTNEPFILSPSEQIVYNTATGKTELNTARFDYVLAWERGQMAFQSASLFTIINEVERRYNVTIYLNETRLSDEKLTVKFFHNETVEEVLEALELIVQGFKYKINGDKIYIY